MSQERVGIIVEIQGGTEALNLMKNLESAVRRLNGTKLKFDFGGKEINGLVSATQNIGTNISQADSRARMLKSTFNSVSSKMLHAGQQFQVIGKTLTQISTPFRSIMRSTLFASGFKVLNSVTEGISKGFSRYDTMKKYPKVMQAFGYSAEQAQNSINKLDLSVRGLPTGLDEMVDMAQRFTATTGDIEKGTDLAIAANNAFLASMSTDTQKYQGMMQLQDVLGGKDMNAREWNSLVSSMTPAIVKMGEAQGYTNKNMDEWIQKVRDGKVANEDFIKTLIKVGTEGGEVAKMAENSKDTWQAFFANVGNATSRMTAGIINALDEVSQTVAGKDLNRLFSDTIIPGIDNLAASIKGWIKANPDVIIDFFNTIKSFDFQGLFRGVGQGMLRTAKDYLGLFKMFTGKDAVAFGRFMARAGFYGKVFNILGGMMKGTRGIVASLVTALKALGMGAKLSAGKGIFGFLGKILGKSKDIEDVAKLPTATQSLRKVASNLSGLLTVFGSTALAVGTGVVAFKGFKTIFSDLKELIGIIRGFEGVDWAIAGGVVAGMVGFIGGLVALGNAVSKIPPQATAGAFVGEVLVGLFTTIGTGFAALNMKLLKSTFSSLESMSTSFKNAMTNLAELGDMLRGNNFKMNDLVKVVKTYNELIPELMKIEGTSYAVKEKSSLVTSAGSMITTLLNTLKEFQNIPELTDAEIQKAKEAIAKAIDKIDELYEDLESHFMDDNVKHAETGASFMTHVSSMIKSIIGSMEDFKAVEGVENIDAMLEAAKTNILAIKDKMKEVYDAIFEDFADFELMGAGAIGGFGTKGIHDSTVDNATNAGTLMGQISAVIQSIRDVYDQISGEEGLATIDLGAFTETINKLTGDGGVISQIKSLYDQLVGEDTGFGGETDVDLSSITSSFATAIGNIKTAVTSLQEIGGVEFEGDGGINAIVGQIRQLVSNLTNAFSEEAVALLTARVEAFKTQITTIKTSIESLGGEAGGINVDIVINHTITGDTATVAALESAHDSIKTARDAIKKLSGSIHLSIPISVSITGVAAAVASMNRAATQLRSARARLRSLSGSVGAYTGGYLAGNGKVLYRKRGGDVAFPGKPRGSDTIPLWASRGEYVHNKHAVDYFGIDFMRKINRLDVRGAMNELMTKAGNMASVGRHTVVNNTYNNNQKVIQNINTNSPDFAFRSASRFAGAF